MIRSGAEKRDMSTPRSQTGRSLASSHVRHYRLVDRQGAPHPVLDDLYESLDAAWSEAMGWWQDHCGGTQEPVDIGVEVSTASGDWRTLRHPGS